MSVIIWTKGNTQTSSEYFIILGLLDLLEPGDSVMADKGFTIADLTEWRGIISYMTL